MNRYNIEINHLPTNQTYNIEVTSRNADKVSDLIQYAMAEEHTCMSVFTPEGLVVTVPKEILKQSIIAVKLKDDK